VEFDSGLAWLSPVESHRGYVPPVLSVCVGVCLYMFCLFVLKYLFPFLFSLI
jgi:hypothetical protein